MPRNVRATSMDPTQQQYIETHQLANESQKQCSNLKSKILSKCQ